MKKIILLAMVCMMAPVAAFAERQDKDPPPVPAINSAKIDFSQLPYQAQVFGENLVGANESLLNVTVAGIPVEFYSLRSDTQLSFEIPVAIAEEGTHRLTLKNVGGQVDYELAIGAVGPRGEKGDPGPAGPAGSAGASGDNALVALTTEEAGSHCTNGGVMFQAGVDYNNNNLLDAEEVNHSKYVCNGTDSGAQPPGSVKVTASPSTQAVNSFVNITVTAEQPPPYGFSFYAAGSCKFFDTATSVLSNYVNLSFGNTASVAMTNTDPAGGPCVAYAGYDDYSSNTTVVGSALATFLPELPDTPAPPPTPITVTATPSTQYVNSYVNVTANFAVPPANGVSVYAGGSCRLYNPATNTLDNYLSTYAYAGVVSVAMTNISSGGGPCIVYAGSYDAATMSEVIGTALATFIPQY